MLSDVSGTNVSIKTHAILFNSRKLSEHSGNPSKIQLEKLSRADYLRINSAI